MARVITLSDKGYMGERLDTSGPALVEMLKSVGFAPESDPVILPDTWSLIESNLKQSVKDGIALVLTTGGTGVSPRDITPDVTRTIIEKEIPGMAEAMRSASSQKTPHAMISRALVGIAGKTLIVNLPGSRKGATENLEAIIPALMHAVEKIHGDPTDCGG
nr:MogA/MoaB family molybdenum cofactor biosynthesis protein [Desulfurispira natronophila]